MSKSRFLLDTNTILYFLGGKVASSIPKGNYYVSVISEIELLSYPNLSNTEETYIRAFLTDVFLVDLNPKVREASIQLRKEHKLKLPDAIIAATAQVYDCMLLTNDKKLLSLAIPAQALPLV